MSKLPVGARLNVSRPLREGVVAGINPLETTMPRPRYALTALPETPIVVSTPLPHMEHLLLYQLRGAWPDSGQGISFNFDPHQSPSTTAQLLARLQQVAPPVTDSELNALLPTFSSVDPKHIDLLWPVETRTMSSGWGPRLRTKTVRVKNRRKKGIRYTGGHQGVDLTAPMGTAVFAALEGLVITSGHHRQYGNYIVLDHGNGICTVYAHHKYNIVNKGDTVRRGQEIAKVGRTGNATGPHLHFELRCDGVPLNPLLFLNDMEEILPEVALQNDLLGPIGSR